MKKVAIIGAGWMTKPLVDYLMETCGYFVILANRTLSKAEDLIAGRVGGKAVRWSTDEPEILDQVVSEADLAVSMVPKPVHIYVARACLRHGKHMLTTAYEIPELIALDEEAKQKGILILNELGEVPGMDHMGTQLVLDEIRQEGGRVIHLNSYGSGLPVFEFNRNPMGHGLHNTGTRRRLREAHPHARAQDLASNLRSKREEIVINRVTRHVQDMGPCQAPEPAPL